jgi:catechol 2,3-dioxygenase-like lactoylglutathione lyase family enzyme
MTSQLFAVCFEAASPGRLARFWSGLLGWAPQDEPGGGAALVPGDGTGFRVRFLPSARERTEQNRMHFDLTSTSPRDQRETVARVLALGGRHADVGQLPHERHVVLADPEGNEFCVVEPGNRFLADCGFVGALSCEGSQETGYFWSAALGWPLVWDRDEETAIRSPHGGPKISWGGPPLRPRTGRTRVHLDLLAPGDRRAEAERLLALGATTGTGDAAELADPDGTAFCLLAPR